MTSAVLYGTTSDNELRPVQVTDFGEFVTDGGGVRDWYENFYVGGTEGAPSISLLSSGNIFTTGQLTVGTPSVFDYTEILADGGLRLQRQASDSEAFGVYDPGGLKFKITMDGDVTAIGDVYAHNFIDTDGYDLSKIGQALSTIHDVIESVDDFQGMKNLFLNLLDNLKSDPTPSDPPTPPDPPTP